MNLKNATAASASVLLASFVSATTFADEIPTPPAVATILMEQGLKYHGQFEVPGDTAVGHAFSFQGEPVSTFMVDDDHLIIGEMIDKNGVSVAEPQLHDMIKAPILENLWEHLENATVVTEGADDAPHELYTITDASCPYCNKMWQESHELVLSGDLKVHHLLVDLIGPESGGKAAAILQADDPVAAMMRHQSRFPAGGIAPVSITAETQAALDENLAIMRSIGGGGTPTSFYQDENGDVQKIGGAVEQDYLQSVFGL